LARTKGKKAAINEKIKQMKEIIDATRYSGSIHRQVDYVLEMINNELNPAYLKVVAHDEVSIRIHAEWKDDPKIVINLIYPI
jgi:hypothetical protein